MVIENQKIELITPDDLGGDDTCHLTNCIINTIDLIAAWELKVHLIIEGCIIDNLLIHSCWFENGLIFKNNIVGNYVDYQMGGHNAKPIVFEGNVFVDFFNFFDCQFSNIIEVKNNVFMKGTNLLGNKGEGFENRFETSWLIENNIGRIDIDEV